MLKIIAKVLKKFPHKSFCKFQHNFSHENLRRWLNNQLGVSTISKVKQTVATEKET